MCYKLWQGKSNGIAERSQGENAETAKEMKMSAGGQLLKEIMTNSKLTDQAEA